MLTNRSILEASNDLFIILSIAAKPIAKSDTNLAISKDTNRSSKSLTTSFKVLIFSVASSVAFPRSCISEDAPSNPFCILSKLMLTPSIDSVYSLKSALALSIAFDNLFVGSTVSIVKFARLDMALFTKSTCIPNSSKLLIIDPIARANGPVSTSIVCFTPNLRRSRNLSVKKDISLENDSISDPVNANNPPSLIMLLINLFCPSVAVTNFCNVPSKTVPSPDNAN